MKNLVLFAASITLLVGCQSNSSDSQASLATRQLNPEIQRKILQAPALSEEAIAQIGKTMKASSIKIPSMNLVFDKYSKQENREKDLSLLDQDGKQFLSKIKASCQVSPETETGSWSPEIGKAHTNEKNKSVSGSNCPISFIGKQFTKMTLTGLDKEKGTVDGHGTIKTSDVFQLLDTSMKQKALTSGWEFHSNMDLFLENYSSTYEGKTKTGGLYGSGTAQGKYLILNGEVPFSMELEMIRSSGRTDGQAIMKINFLEGLLVLGIIKKSGQNQYYVNGQPYTATKIRETFGWNFTGIEFE